MKMNHTNENHKIDEVENCMNGRPCMDKYNGMDEIN
jgi:hypothetical protein